MQNMNSLVGQASSRDAGPTRLSERKRQDPAKRGNFSRISMAKIGDILDLEKKRSEPDEMRSIYLWPDGTFYRAYEWSAWLCVRYIRQFKVTRRMFKAMKTDMLFIGFPQTSLEKFKPETAVVNELPSKCIVLILPEVMVAPDSGSTLEADYQNWRTTIPLAEGKETKLSAEQQSLSGRANTGSVSMTGIMKQILEFPVESHSPIDCMLFLVDVKKNISSLL